MAAVVAIAVVVGFAVLAVACYSVQGKVVARSYLAVAAEVASVLAEVGPDYLGYCWSD